MEKEFTIPENVNVELQGKLVKVSGPKGELKKEFKYFYDIKIEKKDNKIVVSSPSDRKKVRAMVGTIIAHLRNMVKGVTEGYTYRMKVVYSHFPITVKVEGNEVKIHNFLGESVPRVARIVGCTKVEVDGQDIIVSGIDRENVGQTCGNIEKACKISKYDRRIFQDGIYLVESE
jgi:large subunit ribosomal protein L6